MNIPVQQKPKNNDIDMVPMINFVFLLLIFFILSGSLTNGSPLPVLPPKSEALTASDASSNVLTLSADGRLALGNEVMSDAQLAERAGQWRAEHIGEILQLKADAQAPATRVVEVMETLRSAGVERVSLLTTRRRSD